MSGDTFDHLNPPKQARSRRTLERIVQASLEILGEKGPEGLTVQEIVSRASSSVGSFYARFHGKEDLLDYLEERLWREAAARWDQAVADEDWAPKDLGGVVRGAAALFAQAGTARAAYLQALDRGSGGPDDAYASFQRHILSDVERLLLARSGAIAHDDPGVAVRFGLRAMLAVIESPPTDSEGQPMPPDRVQAEAVSMLLRYLGGGRGGPEPAPGDVDFFDIWG